MIVRGIRCSPAAPTPRCAARSPPRTPTCSPVPRPRTSRVGLDAPRAVTATTVQVRQHDAVQRGRCRGLAAGLGQPLREQPLAEVGALPPVQEVGVGQERERSERSSVVAVPMNSRVACMSDRYPAERTSRVGLEGCGPRVGRATPGHHEGDRARSVRRAQRPDRKPCGRCS